MKLISMYAENLSGIVSIMCGWTHSLSPYDKEEMRMRGEGEGVGEGVGKTCNGGGRW